MLELQQGRFNVTIHGGNEVAFLYIIPFQINSNVASDVPVRFHDVIIADELLKMQGILFVNILHAKTINNKGEGDEVGSMEIHAWDIPKR